MNQPVSLMRATPPALPILGTSIRNALQTASLDEGDEGEYFRQHRFDGTAPDKESAARWIGQRFSSPPDVGRIVVTNGTMNSLLLLMAAVLGPNATLATEALTFPQVKVIASLFNIAVAGIPIDEDGMRADAFEDLCRSAQKPKALYCNPTLQSPTATIMPLARRMEIAQIARRYNVLVIEDEAQALYANSPPPPIATLVPELTWYLMGLSKYLSLGVRAAFVLAPSIDAKESLLARVRTLSTWHVAPLVAKVVMDWIKDGTAQRLFSAAREEIHARNALIREVFGDSSLLRTSQGIHFWLKAPAHCTGAEFERAAHAAGVLVRSSDLYDVGSTRSLQGIRPAIGDPSREKLLQGLHSLRQVIEQLQKRPQREYNLAQPLA